MPIYCDFTLSKFEDGAIVVKLDPPLPIGGMQLQFMLGRRITALPDYALVTKVAASGFGGGQSGITVTNSGQGIMSIRINRADTSGLDPGAYAGWVRRMDVGNETELWRGYGIITQ